jgi:hydrogenase maturation protease
MRKDIVVVGLGNPLMGDEGIGCRVVEELSQWADEYPGVDFIDAGTGGMAVLHHIAERKKAVLIDCAYMGQKPGTILRFRRHDVASVKKLAHQSLHEADLLKILELSTQLGQSPEETVVFGIEPLTIAPDDKLSEPVANKIDEYVAAVLSELSQ